MQSLKIDGCSGSSSIWIENSLNRLQDFFRPGKMVLLTDTNVASLYQSHFPTAPVLKIGTGEAVKTLNTVHKIYAQLVEMEADRSWLLVGIGGGIVTDVTGFIAATYLRGIDFGFVASTLLAQVDAAIGGKNGVNFKGYKNLIGTFHQPRFVICNLEMLATLPEWEFRNGLAEVIKTAAIANRQFWEYLESHVDAILNLEPAVMEHVVFRAASIKAEIVREDEQEAGRRRILNFGHTLGHAYEKLLGVSHGEAISAGMRFATQLSCQITGLPEKDAARLEQLLNRVGLPVSFKADRLKIIDAVRHDKKRQAAHLHFVLLKELGVPEVVEIPLIKLEAYIADLCQSS
jgi:3-dehydroquinate synthase